MLNSTRIILGIDPGLQVTGYGLLEGSSTGPIVREAGVIRLPQRRGGSDLVDRLRSLYDSLMEILDQFHPDVLAVEQLYAHYKHPRTAILMGHARGVLLLGGAQRGLEVTSYPATTIKKTITGNGRAPKTQIQLAICRELRLPQVPEPSDVADALAVALCHFHLQRAAIHPRLSRQGASHRTLNRPAEASDD